MKKIISLAAILLIAAACNKTSNNGTNPTTSGSQQGSQTGQNQQTQYSANSNITVDNNGQTFTYPVSTKFNVELDKTNYPQAELNLSCNVPNVLSGVPNALAVKGNLYAASYQSGTTGTCIISNRDFSIEVVIK